MLKKVFIIVSVFTFNVKCFTQNIVPNGDFENFSALPTDLTQWNYCNNWTNAGGLATPDYYNTNGSGAGQIPNFTYGLVSPFSGNGVMGFATYGGNMEPEYREYIMTQLTTPMIVGNTYQITFHLTNAESNSNDVYSTDHIGIRFSTNPLSQLVKEPINVIPQIEIAGVVWSTSWQTYTFTFVADAAYTYMTFGNFFNDANTTAVYQNTGGMDSYAYYYIDKVSVIGDLLPTATISGTTTICSGNSAIITFTGTPDAFVTYTVDGGSSQSILLDAQGNATITTNALTANTNYTITNVALTVAPFTNQIVSGTAIITVEPPIAVSFTSDLTTGCAPLKVSFTNTTVNSANCTWDFGDQTTALQCGTVTHTYSEGGIYDVTLNVLSPSGCPNNVVMPSLITVLDSPKANFTSSASENFNVTSNVSFTNLSTGAISYLWDFSDGETSTTISPEHDFSSSNEPSNIVSLVAYGANGCTDTAFQEIKLNELIFYIPNTFTPDGNNYNQIFQPVFTSGFDKRDYQMLIFNRWGEQIFETNDITEGWDGTFNGISQSDGIYIWSIVFKVNSTDAKKEVKGHVCLLR